jgi:hypothetical protein
MNRPNLTELEARIELRKAVEAQVNALLEAKSFMLDSVAKNDKNIEVMAGLIKKVDTALSAQGFDEKQRTNLIPFVIGYLTPKV